MKRIVNALGKLNWGKRAYAVFVLCATTAIALPAQTFTTLHSFNGTDGASPEAAPVQATNGSLYGTTPGGGANGGGTVFRITPSGTLTTLYSFCSQSGCTDGSGPFPGLVQATNGDLYGTTNGGGANCAPYGCGTVFKITPSGTLATLYSFCYQSNCTDGADPDGALVQATNGNLYGTTTFGGASNVGTVFEITPGGTLTTLHSFDATDGAEPFAGLVQATNGDFYGMTSTGGATCSPPYLFGCGTVFKITPTGTLTTVYTFCSQGSNCADGAVPEGTLVQATNGNLYGATEIGGTASATNGTVFTITPSGTLTTLHSFCYCTGGANPYAGLVQATDGNFYGTTETDGAHHGGTIFKITPKGKLTTLYNFCSQSGCTDGENPYATLVQDTDGTFYGTTASGGTNGYGTVFSLSVGLGPFVETQTTSGKVGAAVKILGTDLTGATSVTFNGTAATFTVVSRYLITTTVPAGASTGKVQVVIPIGTLSSNAPFRVVP
jgi:uncharacterized repeat protein (TIGR03803 family)